MTCFLRDMVPPGPGDPARCTPGLRWGAGPMPMFLWGGLISHTISSVVTRATKTGFGPCDDNDGVLLTKAV
jgi:hypothetical protein